jgi:sec-independent protein translocase protein TatA
MFGLGHNELLIILVVILILFGGRKLPELARGLGQGLKEFKSASKETSVEEEKKPEATP